MVKRVLVLSAFIALIASAVSADPRFTMGVTFTSGFPQGSFHDNIDNTGYGVTWDTLLRVSKDSPFSVGGSLGFVQYGSRDSEALLSSTIPVIVPVDTSNNILLA